MSNTKRQYINYYYTPESSKNRNLLQLTAGIERLSLPEIRENEDRLRTFEGENLD